MNICIHFDQTRPPKHCELQAYLTAPRDCGGCSAYEPDPCFHEREFESDRERDALWIALLTQYRVIGN